MDSITIIRVVSGDPCCCCIDDIDSAPPDASSLTLRHRSREETPTCWLRRKSDEGHGFSRAALGWS